MALGGQLIKLITLIHDEYDDDDADADADDSGHPTNDLRTLMLVVFRAQTTYYHGYYAIMRCDSMRSVCNCVSVFACVQFAAAIGTKLIERPV